METKITLKLHANYVETSIRFQTTSMTYLEYGTCDPKIARDILELPTRKDVREYLDNGVFYLHEQTLDGFEGFFELKFTFTNHETSNDFVVEYANFVTPKKGGKRLDKAFQNTKFKLPVLRNLFNVVAERNSEKIISILTTLANAF